MDLLNRLFGRRRAVNSDVARTIADALDRAGLDAAAPAGVRATIDRALGAAGLARGSRVPPAPAEPAKAGGDWVHATYAGPAGRRDYRLYRPAGHAGGEPMPLLLMLHGCTQTPEDFAAGTRMNALADRHGFLVAYPEQTAKENGARCWNWFRPEDQQPGRGEPAILAGIVHAIAGDHRVDPARVFAAGLSAGAAMAVVLGRVEPTLFAAIGVHSGVPYAAAHDVASAFAAMQGHARSKPPASPARGATPMIVFHGTRDTTVAPANADALVRDALPQAGPLAHSQQRGDVAGGHAYTRDVYIDARGRPRLEQWTVHGAGHAWSGGSVAGTYTDPQGPDASAEMLRFFLAQAAG